MLNAVNLSTTLAWSPSSGGSSPKRCRDMSSPAGGEDGVAGERPEFDLSGGHATVREGLGLFEVGLAVEVLDGEGGYLVGDPPDLLWVDLVVGLARVQ